MKPLSRETAKEAVRMLERYRDFYSPFCTECLQESHAPDCPLARVISELNEYAEGK